MKVITKRELIENIAERWKNQWCYNGRWSYDDKLVIYNKLIKLDTEVATEEDIKNIIGSNSWTSCRCGECNEDKQSIIVVGEEPDYDSATACLCLNCVEGALKLLQRMENDN